MITPRYNKGPAQLAITFLNYLVLLGVVFLILFPLIWLLSSSFKTHLEVLEFPPTFRLNWAAAYKNYQSVLVGRGFIQFIRNSILITFLSTLAALILGTPAAYGLSRFSFRGKHDLAFWILSNRFIPIVAVATPLYFLVREIDLLNTKVGLTLPYIAFNLPLVVWIMQGFFDDIPRDMDDAALVDGCSRWEALWHVILPLTRPGLVTTAIFCVIFTWNEMLLGLYITSTRISQTVPVGAAGLISMDRGIDWGISATVGIVTILPVFIFSLLVRKEIVRGLTAGAIK
jgi:multiple sugar transport system permease protein